MKYAMLIDQSKCIGCSACSVECKREYDEASFGILRTSMVKYEKGDFPNTVFRFRKNACMHCLDNAACIGVCPVQAISYIRHEEGGMVQVDQDTCIGCGLCIGACPFGAPVLDADRGKAEKCSFCFERGLKGRPTYCAEACPVGAIAFGQRDDMISQGQARVEALKGKGKNQANLYGQEGTGVLLVLDYDPADYELPDETTLASGLNLPRLGSAAGKLTVVAALGGLGISIARQYQKGSREKVEVE